MTDTAFPVQHNNLQIDAADGLHNFFSYFPLIVDFFQFQDLFA